MTSIITIFIVSFPILGFCQDYSVAFRDFHAYQVLQRNPITESRIIYLTGTVPSQITSPGNHIFARVTIDSTNQLVIPWKRVHTTYGAFYDSLNVPLGGWYSLQYLNNNVYSYSQKFGVGLNFLCIGQSNMSGRGGPAPYHTTPDRAAMYSNDSGWKHLSDPFDRGGSPGQIDNDGANAQYSMIPALASLFVEEFNVPVGFIPACKGSTAMWDNVFALPWSSQTWGFRDPVNHKNLGTLYGNSLAKIDSVGGIEAIIMDQGEKDIGNGYSNYKNAFQGMLAHYREDVGPDIQVFYVQIGNKFVNPDSLAHAEIRQAQADVADGSLNFMAATTMDLSVSSVDSVHYTAASLDTIAQRMGNIIVRYLR